MDRLGCIGMKILCMSDETAKAKGPGCATQKRHLRQV